MITKYIQENPKLKKVIVNQFFGLGDILFIEPIYRYLTDLGLQVIAPVQDQYIWIQDHIPYVDFRKMSEFEFDYEKFDYDMIDEETLYIPMRFSDQIHRNLPPHDSSASYYWMTDKYRVLGLEPKLWESIALVRDLEKEQALKEIVVGDVAEYDFCNSYFQNTQNIEMDIQIDTEFPLINMEKIEGYSMVDWCSIIEGARNVHTVSTSLLYMIQSIYSPDQEYHLYPRGIGANHYTIEDFLPSFWIKH